MPLLPQLLVCTLVCFHLGTASSSAIDVVRALSEASALLERGLLTRRVAVAFPWGFPHS